MIIEWINENKEWVFSGVGLFLLGGLLRFIYYLFQQSDRPRLEIEIPPTLGIKERGGSPSPRNPRVIDVTEVIRFNSMRWKYSIKIKNNSSFTAYRPRIKFCGKKRFTYFQKLNEHNSILPHKEVEIIATFEKTVESKAREANRIAAVFFPQELVGLKLVLEFENEKRKKFRTKFRIISSSLYKNT